jgi:hypothetical protein
MKKVACYLLIYKDVVGSNNEEFRRALSER